MWRTIATGMMLLAGVSLFARVPETKAQALPGTFVQALPGTFVNEKRADQWLASDLRAKNVYDRNDAKIGAINDLLIDRDGRISAVIIGVGGFLGIGEKNVGVPFADIKISLRDGNEWLVLERSREDLRAAPAFGPATGTQGKAAGDRSYGTMDGTQKPDEKQR